jgi:hypothetical protein
MLQSCSFVAMAPVLGLAAYCLTHVLACQVVRHRGPYLPLLIGFFPGLIVTLAVSLAAALGMQAQVVDCLGLLGLNFLTYLALAWGYFHFVNLNVASLRIRMLHEIAEAGGQMAKSQLLARYNADNTITLRIDRLVRGGHLIERQGRFYRGKGGFLLAARVFDLLRGIILGPSLFPGMRPNAPSTAGSSKEQHEPSFP